MQNSFFQAICRAGIFMICAQALIHFRPQEAYEKYLKLLVSLMVLVQLFLPIGGFLLGGGTGEAAELMEKFRQDLKQGMKDAEEGAAEMDAVLQHMTLEEIRNNLQENPEPGEGDPGNAEESGEKEADERGTPETAAGEEREDPGEEPGEQGIQGEEGEPEKSEEPEREIRIEVKVEPVETITIIK